MPGMLKGEAQIGLYAAISADQAANLAPPASFFFHFHFSFPNSQRREKQPKGTRAGRGYIKKRKKKKNPPKRLVFIPTFPSIRISNLIKANRVFSLCVGFI